MCGTPSAFKGKFLFDIKNDPRECTNLAKTNPAIVENLAALLRAYQDAGAVPDRALSFPSDDPSGDPELREDGAWGPFVNSTLCVY